MAHPSRGPIHQDGTRRDDKQPRECLQLSTSDEGRRRVNVYLDGWAQRRAQTESREAIMSETSEGGREQGDRERETERGTRRKNEAKQRDEPGGGDKGG